MPYKIKQGEMVSFGEIQPTVYSKTRADNKRKTALIKRDEDKPALAQAELSLQKVMPDVTVLQARALDAYNLGYGDDDCIKICGLKKTEWINLKHSKKGVEYIRLSNNILNSSIMVEKRRLIEELYSRLPSANNKDAIAIVAQLSKMMEYEKEEANSGLTVVFTNDPWKKI
jgi:hypothetical protein